MDEIKITWQELTFIASFCGIIIALVKFIANDIRDSVKKLVDKTNGHTVELAVESKRNDDQDETLQKHGKDIESIKERVWQVRYTKKSG